MRVDSACTIGFPFLVKNNKVVYLGFFFFFFGYAFSCKPLTLQHHVRQWRIWPQVLPWHKLCIRCKSFTPLHLFMPDSPILISAFAFLNISQRSLNCGYPAGLYYLSMDIDMLGLRNVFMPLPLGAGGIMFWGCPCVRLRSSLAIYLENDWLNVCKIYVEIIIVTSKCTD